MLPLRENCIIIENIDRTIVRTVYGGSVFMNRFLCLCFCLIWPLSALAHPQQADRQQKKFTTKTDGARPKDRSLFYVRLSALPNIRSPVEPALTAEEKRHILDLIAQLAEIVDTNYLDFPTEKDNFDPVSGAKNASAFIMVNHQRRPSPAMLELVNYPMTCVRGLQQRPELATPPLAEKEPRSSFPLLLCPGL